ncbi:efflux RND transporter periplasmic adaptor subunit [Aestuariibacter halophilus]|uniref:Efflux RND transporter periplasmic adaptor subunit n=1 Tax=Fluctibacter halophilus TaxID=226011 RepID=A0ABS8G4B8_9ALTE|nr:efflux RND transporter periplasmic adaptor subunit [Aestuariibacter halophilus]MCC2615442.1 efflux RND transporter periplasmic adaptor subunit [Aestuariibacter halophilus]
MKAMFKSQATALALAISFSMGALAQQAPPEPPPALVEIDDVRSEMIAEQIWVPGTVVSRTDSDIASEVAGRITWMADVGEVVQAGDVMVRLDDKRLQLTLGQNDANIAKWQSRVDLLERKQGRFTTMAAQNATSKDQLDEITSELEIARQELQQARLDRELTAYHIAQSQVKAPFTAMVVDRLQTPGEYTSIGQNLLRIVDTTNIEASIRAPLSAIPFIKTDMEVLVKNNHQSLTEKVRAIVPVGNAQSRMMEVRVQLRPGDFAIGSAVRVALPHSDFHQGTTVPRDALVLRKAGAFIYQVDDDNLAQQVAVRTGIGVGERIEVFGEVNDASPVIIRGAERLRPGQKVRYLDEGEQTAAIN